MLKKLFLNCDNFFSAINCRKNWPAGKSPIYVKNNDFSSILYDELFKKYTKPKFKNGDRVTISKNDISLQAYEKFSEKITSCCLPTKYSNYHQKQQRDPQHISKKISKKKKFWANFMKKS